MKRLPSAVITCAFLVGASGSRARAEDATRSDVAEGVLRLASSVDRLLTMLEKDAQLRTEEKEARRVEVVVAILGIRYRKIAELESDSVGSRARMMRSGTPCRC